MEKTVSNRLEGAIGKAMSAIFVGCGVMIAVAGHLPAARADSADDRYVQRLMDVGIGVKAPPDRLIRLGHMVCADIGHGNNPVDDGNGLYGGADLSEHNRTLAGAAVDAYCPQFKNQIGG